MYKFKRRRQAELEHDVNQALADLGGTDEEVTANLIAGGFKGVTCKVQWCPVARYLKAKFPDATVITGYGQTGVQSAHSGDVWVPNPPQVEQFIHDFDFGRHPELEK